MNNNVMKLLVAGLVCGALCGTTLAASHGGHGNRAPNKPKMHQKAPPAHHAPAHHATKHHVTHHAPPPPPPAPVVVHHEHHTVSGLAVLGALVGGLVGAAL